MKVFLIFLLLLVTISLQVNARNYDQKLNGQNLSFDAKDSNLDNGSKKSLKGQTTNFVEVNLNIVLKNCQKSNLKFELSLFSDEEKTTSHAETEIIIPVSEGTYTIISGKMRLSIISNNKGRPIQPRSDKDKTFNKDQWIKIDASINQQYNKLNDPLINGYHDTISIRPDKGEVFNKKFNKPENQPLSDPLLALQNEITGQILWDVAVIISIALLLDLKFGFLKAFFRYHPWLIDLISYFNSILLIELLALLILSLFLNFRIITNREAEILGSIYKIIEILKIVRDRKRE